ncbi:serine aminopeptidase S33 family [Micromonospora kangleipakensis]|uniref:Serine aminopeptidase S33 family n=1 Tax=Micromonospora kangleipakensis TaxID=1077942 RepID=A0A4Q8BFA9_9ACTN|nr:alpha/beta fold hydrolase [Micromonospora kangleipakensis]RZU75849.1 serine aminopeptidase S33 family [Micromonospora kangleipakensis]
MTGVRTCADLVDELAGLLAEVAAPTPWLLVGHSFGGLVARLLAARQPRAVAGLVLVDAVVEYRETVYEPVLPAHLRAANRAYLTDPARNAERIDKPVSYRQVAAHPLPRGVSASVITRGRPDAAGPDWPALDILRIDQRMQRDLVRRHGVRHRIAARSGHDVHHDEPDVVLAEIMTMLERTRG